MKYTTRNGMTVWVGLRFKFKNYLTIHTIVAIEKGVIVTNFGKFYFDGPTSHYKLLNKCVNI